MATQQRKRSESGFYHVFQRGVNHFDIFEDDSDRLRFLEMLLDSAAESETEIHAWCFMSNHVHLLVRADHDSLSAMMRQLGSIYARYFNKTHLRSGPLFEGRFGSVCVESDAQLASVVRYIHRNPSHHDETALIGDYPWSSYSEYFDGCAKTCRIDFVLDLFSSHESFVAFHESWDCDERHLDIGVSKRMGDDEARIRANAALENAGFEVSVSNLGALPRKLRDKALTCVKHAIDCSIRQLQRLTAIAYSAVRNAVTPECEEEDEFRSHDAALTSFASELRDSIAPASRIDRFRDKTEPGSRLLRLGRTMP